MPRPLPRAYATWQTWGEALLRNLQAEVAGILSTLGVTAGQGSGLAGPIGPPGQPGEGDGSVPTLKFETFGPVTLPNGAGAVVNLIAPANAGASGVGYTPTASFIILRHLRVLNKTGGAQTFSLFLGASLGTAAGTEVIGSGKSVPANDAVDWNGQLRIPNGSFLTGYASAGTALVLEAEGEVGLA